jgi:hypothetical protein
MSQSPATVLARKETTTNERLCRQDGQQIRRRLQCSKLSNFAVCEQRAEDEVVSRHPGKHSIFATPIEKIRRKRDFIRGVAFEHSPIQTRRSSIDIEQWSEEYDVDDPENRSSRTDAEGECCYDNRRKPRSGSYLAERKGHIPHQRIHDWIGPLIAKRLLQLAQPAKLTAARRSAPLPGSFPD